MIHSFRRFTENYKQCKVQCYAVKLDRKARSHCSRSR